MKMVEKENDNAAAATVANGLIVENGPVKVLPPNNKNNENLIVLARLFLKEYYTKLSDCPNEAGIFYGDESHFVHGDVEETGRENIQRAIAEMDFQDCKARFYSIKGVAQGDDDKVFQVCGELTLMKAKQTAGDVVAPRRFVQTIVLAHQTPTLLYVKSDVFQWLDTAFSITPGEKYSPANNAGNAIPSPPTVADVDEQPPQQQPLENGGMESPLVNGGSGVGEQFHHRHQQQQTFEEAKAPTSAGKATTETPFTTSNANGGEQPQPEKSSSTFIAPPTPKKNNELPPTAVVAHPPAPVSSAAEHPHQQREASVTTVVTVSKPKAVSGSYAAIAAAARNQQQHTAPPMPQQFQPPRTTAQQPKENSNNNNKTTKNTNAAAAPAVTEKALQQVAPAPPQQQRKAESANEGQQRSGKTDEVQQNSPSPPVAQATATAGNFPPRRDWPHRIYFSQLIKPGRFVDFKRGQQELMREILSITDGVEFVGVKPISLRREYRSAFGFIDLTSSSDVQAVYDASKKEPNGTYRLKVSIPAFEFKGELSLSSDKTSNLIGVGGRDTGMGRDGGGGTGGGNQQQQYRQSSSSNTQQGY